MGIKYVGGDVHSQFTVFVVLDDQGRLLSQQDVPTRRLELEEFARSLGGDACIAIEEGTQAMWLFGLLSPHVKQMVVCDARRVPKTRSSLQKSDYLDAFDLAEGLRLGGLCTVYKGYEESVKAVHQLGMSYSKIVGDLQRTKSRLNSLCLGAGIGQRNGLYGQKNREILKAQIKCRGVRSRAEILYAELDVLEELKKEAQTRLVKESSKHQVCRLLRTIPGIGAIYAARILGVVGTPHRFQGRGKFWSYCGLAVVHRSTGVIEWGPDGRPQRNRKKVRVLGLNRNRNALLKETFMSAAVVAIRCSAEIKGLYEGYVAAGLHPSTARVHTARKLATIALTVWKKGEKYDSAYLTPRKA